MNREQRLRRIKTIKKIAAVYPVRLPGQPSREEPAAPPTDKDWEQVEEWRQKLEETERPEVEETAAVPREEYLDTVIDPSQRGPLTESLVDMKSSLWRTHHRYPVPGKEEPDFYILDPQKASVEEKYMGAKLQDEEGNTVWAPTPTSDLFYLLATQGEGAPRDPNRGAIEIPGGHRYNSLFGPGYKATPLTEEAEQTVLQNLPRIFDAIGSTLPRAATEGEEFRPSVRNDTNVRWVTHPDATLSLEISDSRHGNVQVPLGQLSPEAHQDFADLQKSVEKSTSSYPELQGAINEFVDRLDKILQEQWSVNRRLRFRSKDPTKMIRVRDIMVRTVIELFKEALERTEFAKLEPVAGEPPMEESPEDEPTVEMPQPEEEPPAEEPTEEEISEELRPIAPESVMPVPLPGAELPSEDEPPPPLKF